MSKSILLNDELSLIKYADGGYSLVYLPDGTEVPLDIKALTFLGQLFIINEIFEIKDVAKIIELNS